jgi:hypothetical protein
MAPTKERCRSRTSAEVSHSPPRPTQFLEWPLRNGVIADVAHTGNNNSYTGNTVVSHAGQFYGACAQYQTGDPADHVTIDYNSYYSANASFDDGGCGAAQGLSWSDWQRSGLRQDTHSTLRDSAGLSWAAMLTAGRAMLPGPF